MAATIRIPTEFTAVDKFTSVVAKMTSGVSNFTKSTTSAVSRVNTKINSVFNSLGNLGQLALGIGLAGIFSAGIDSVKEYETALASFRTIVSDLSDKDFAKYRQEINNVAKDTKSSSIDVALSFEKIAGLNSDLAKTADGLGLVSKAAIVLSKASGDELGVSAENLVGIMNQFTLGAKDADRVINVLAAGQAVGASTITQSAEAYKNFGAVAKGANITLEESQALIQTLGKFSLFGAEAGTKLRGATLQLQKAGLGYASGQFNINDALNEANKISKSLTTQRAKDTFVLKTFGAENITAGKILLDNIEVYKKYTTGVTNTTEAQKAAEINSNTLSKRIDELKNSLINMLTSSDQTNEGLNIFKDLIVTLTDNLPEIVGILTKVVAGFVAFKVVNGIITLATGILSAYSVAVAWYGAVATTAALTGASFAAVIWATVWPILAVIAAIAAIIAIFYYWDEIVSWFSRMWETFVNNLETAWLTLVQTFTNFDFVGLFMSIGQSIINFMLLPLKSVLKLVAMIPGGIGKAAQMGLDKVNAMTDVKMLLGKDNKKLESPEQVKSENAQKNKLSGGMDINIRDKGNNVENVTPWANSGIPIKLTPTQGSW